MKQRQLIVKFLLVVGGLLAGSLPLAAQEGTRVPKSGGYAHRAPGTNLLYESRDAGNIEGFLKVSGCGDIINLSAPGQPTITLNYRDGAWAGSKVFDGHKISYLLKSESETEVLFQVIFPFRASEPSSLTLVAEAENNGSAAIRPVGVEETRESLFWVVEEKKYILDLYDFEIDRAELLPQHESAIEQALSMILDETSKTSGRACEQPLMPTVAKKVVGYASQTGPESNNLRLANARARVAAGRINELMRSRTGDVFFQISKDKISYRRGTGNEELLNAPGLESKCNRRAVWQFSIRKRYIDPYKLSDARKWLERDLKAVCQASSTSDTDTNNTTRLLARGKYVLAVNYLDMLAAGYCKPVKQGHGEPDSEAAARLLDSTNPFSLEKPGGKPKSGSFDGAVDAAFEVASDQAVKMFANTYDSEEHRRQEWEKMTENPYYCYTFSQNDSAAEEARGIEQEICHSVAGNIEADPKYLSEEVKVIESGFCSVYRK